MRPKNSKGASPKKPKKRIEASPRTFFLGGVLLWCILSLVGPLISNFKHNEPLLKGGKQVLKELIDNGGVGRLTYDRESWLYIYLNEKGVKQISEQDSKADLEGQGPHFRIDVGGKYWHEYHKEFSYIKSNERLQLNEVEESWFLNRVIALIQKTLSLLSLVLLFAFLFMDPLNLHSKIAGSSKAVLWDQKRKTGIMLKDVQGMMEIKEQLVDVVHFFKYPKPYARLGAKPPKGILLVGPPGTGKTLIARAIAGEAGVPFISVSGSEFEDMYVGVGADRVRKLFAMARKNAPCIVFIDEIDVVAPRRRNSANSADSLSTQTLNQLLTEIDGFKQNKMPILVIGSTNRPNVLDPAITRHGRLGTKIETNYPVMVERESTFRYYATKIKVGPGIDYAFLARQTSFFSYADIEQVCNRAALIAVKKGRVCVTQEDFLAAIDQEIGGIERRTKKLSNAEKKRVAIHETGHAMVGHFCGRPLVRLTIVPRLGATLGFAHYHKDDEKRLQTKEEMLNEVCTAMGGRAAEEVHLGQISDGAQNDLEKATKMTYSMITILGMSDKIGHLSYYDSRNPDVPFNFSPELSKAIDEEARKWISQQYERAKSILKKHPSTFERIYQALLEHETLSGAQFLELVKEPKVAVTKPEASPEKPTSSAS